jgi:hypothetical protein
MGLSENGNEILGFIKGRVFIDKLIDPGLLTSQEGLCSMELVDWLVDSLVNMSVETRLNNTTPYDIRTYITSFKLNHIRPVIM